MKDFKKILITLTLVMTILVPTTFANASDDLELAIKKQEMLIAELTAKKEQEAKETKIQELEKKVEDYNKLKEEQNSFKSTLEQIQNQLQTFMENNKNSELDETLKELKQKQSDLSYEFQNINNNQLKNVYQPAITAPINNLSNTQDAINSQRDAENVFAYYTGGIYKIYCKVGFLTDIKFKQGEEITFVGGGDTAKWVIDNSTTGVGEKAISHIYIKPIMPNISTNLIVNTTNHTYQIIVNSSDFYNPIVSWSYSSEEQLSLKINKEKDNLLFTEKNLNLSNPDSLNFNYKIKGKDYIWKPEMVFDDGLKTYIKMPESVKQGNAPVLFVKEKGSKNLSIVNYRVKNNFYIVDRLFKNAEMRVSEKETIKIVS